MIGFSYSLYEERVAENPQAWGAVITISITTSENNAIAYFG
jgi:hypothetical protein